MSPDVTEFVPQRRTPGARTLPLGVTPRHLFERDYFADSFYSSSRCHAAVRD
ncbi:hypothetical protein PAMC26577_05880 [Caballeronia sordidicola]|uniref:Uncharacterized protein n=1 Tax=Caballeronia sordidicola TaxID=196367 RepID=A0A242N3C0_CABSO|nr:hypothetical protein PAMC26577_05880 [Caballeronia sordidicola]